MKKLLFAVLVLFLVATSWVGHQLHTRPALDSYASIQTAPAIGGEGIRVTFLGVSTLLLRDSSTAVLVDGFFSRPGLFSTALLPIGPDQERISAALTRAGIEHLDAIVAVHSHYDHAMDSPEVAKRTGAVLVGSLSTANIARGQDLPENQIHVVAGSEVLHFGDLTLTLIPSQHFPHGKAMGEIATPLVPPARAIEYLEGGSFSILIERNARRILVQASAGYVEGALADRQADVVYLGVGLLGSKDQAYRDAYWRETVTAVHARRVIPIHWDDFTRGLDDPLVALPFLLDDLDASMAFVQQRAASEQVDVRWPVLWQSSDPFAGL